MNRHARPVAVLAVLLAVVGVVSLVGYRVAAAGPDRVAMWKRVAEAEKKSLPKTAIQELQPIIDSAVADKAYPEAVKAVAKKVTLEAVVEGDKPEVRIVRMKGEIAKAPAEMRPAMDALLAHWYLAFYHENAERFFDRTELAKPLGDDPLTWDRTRIVAEVDAQFSKALANAAVLQGTPIETYAVLLEKGTVPDSYRPTLFDFLAFDALDFYTSNSLDLPSAEGAFQIEADGPALGSAAEFLKWEPKAADADSRLLKAVRLYRALLKFHADDADPSARIDADLNRLQTFRDLAVGDRADERYRDALKAIAEKYESHELSAVARAAWAETYLDDTRKPLERAKAKAIAEVGAAAFPDKVGGKQCFNLVQKIVAKELRLGTERVWADPRPAIAVTYRNIDKVHFRAYRIDWAARAGNAQLAYPESPTDDERKTILNAKPDRAWSADLPATADFNEKTVERPTPADLPPGCYLLFASGDADFKPSAPQFCSAVWISNLALVHRPVTGDRPAGGMVLDARLGTPISGAKLKFWVRTRNGKLVPAEDRTTDDNGSFDSPAKGDERYLCLASHGSQQIASEEHGIGHLPGHGTPHTSVVLFTDRSIYRPGQTIRYKGIVYSVDRQADQYAVKPKANVTVRFEDPNDKEIARVDAIANEFGSFSGSFVAPRDRLTGSMQIVAQLDGGDRGSANVQVEEYKRPQFVVALDAPKEAAKLGERVKLTGRATAYSGAAVGGAAVKFRVRRTVRFFGWGPGARIDAEIGHGRTVTDADGTFAVEFVARPDPNVSESMAPIFHYEVTADVTDSTGETRSANRTANVGTSSLALEVKANEYLPNAEPVALRLTANTHDGEGQKTSGTVRVYALKTPSTILRPRLVSHRVGDKDPASPETWANGDLAATLPFDTDAGGTATVSAKLPVGIYRALVETKDRFGRPATAHTEFTVVDPTAAKLAVPVPNLLAAPSWTVEPGQEFTAVWGTGYDTGRAFVEVLHRGKTLQAYWTPADRTQVQIRMPVKEEHRGGFSIRVTYVRENRSYSEAKFVQVPWSNKNLTVKWETFTSKLEPGQKTKWTAVVTGPNAKGAVAEMVAGMYDASLDQYLAHGWHQRFADAFRQESQVSAFGFDNRGRNWSHFAGDWKIPSKELDLIFYRTFPGDFVFNQMKAFLNSPNNIGAGGGVFGAIGDGLQHRSGFGGIGGGFIGGFGGGAGGTPPSVDMIREVQDALEVGTPLNAMRRGEASKPNLDAVLPRTNRNETAFFFPQLVSADDGSVRIEFTLPDAVTTWKFFGFAHDQDLRSGFLESEAVSSKDLMVQPNPPRFLREGDELEFTVKVSNKSKAPQTGTVRLAFTDAQSGQPVDAALGNAANERKFDVPANESRTYFWRVSVPEGQGPLLYAAVGSTDKLSDGEDGLLPVLSKRVLVTESLPLPIRGPAEAKFALPKLLDSGNSKTLRTQSLTVQMASNPAWYAVMALPYLMEFPHECSEQTFSRFYANALARHIASRDPKVRKIFDRWRDSPGTLDSPLEKNQDLKSVLLDETPWVRQAAAESKARKNVGILFDDNRLADETARTHAKLSQMRAANGLWPWFPGGPTNEYITLTIVAGYGRLRAMGVEVDVADAVAAVPALDAWVDREYRELLKREKKPGEIVPSPTVAFWLYARSSFAEEAPLAAANKEAFEFWVGQSKKHWTKLDRMSQAHVALALKRLGDKRTPTDIVKSIKEHSVSSEELGTFWRDTELAYSWNRAPIETQALMVELFDEVAGDPATVEGCKVWLLKQKQTQDWKTTRATADAVYALLRRGDDLLKSDAIVEVKLAGEVVRPEKVEAGTGFYEHRVVRTEVKPEMGNVAVKKADAGIAWGAIHWQYLEDVNKITPHSGTPLKLEKAIYRKTATAKGPVLEPIAGSVQVGEELVVRVVLRTDRDMEYVHLKDHRGSGTEPVNVLSRYKWQDGLGYYESTRDTATHFYIDYLAKGTYVFEYPVRVVHKGKYPSGLATVQCMYAPEFNAHSASTPLEAK